jgi:hypothetical protein
VNRGVTQDELHCRLHATSFLRDSTWFACSHDHDKLNQNNMWKEKIYNFYHLSWLHAISTFSIIRGKKHPISQTTDYSSKVNHQDAKRSHGMGFTEMMHNWLLRSLSSHTCLGGFIYPLLSTTQILYDVQRLCKDLEIPRNQLLQKLQEINK